ncbi:von Willebrand factor type A domain-containing protein [Halopenitus malekzadehii]|uniref:von Willebrand factor type A domain-containing protein n=1 Tax=Halopenitus malekzadehii TaxID=1267564 RepID=A0A1H6J7P9_9EURY|nr:vWA domain-containing protein [Halopenitus malekzadehii]SEH56352.1 von Willebrand factor type A domain-containing protein [Halopenitus malekzadehii]
MDAHITFVLDSSGSMSAIGEDTIGGFNTFLVDQRNEKGSATVSLVDFDSTVDITYRGTTIESAPELSKNTYTPGGQTALYDAIYTAIENTASFIDDIDPENRPEIITIVILTDGKENASEIPQSAIREQIETRKQVDSWEFLFIGANQDAALTAEGMGIDANKSLDMAHSGDGARAAYDSTSQRISDARSTGTMSNFTEEDRSRQDEERR